MAQLDIALDRSSDMPVGIQLAWQLRALIASGRLAEGEQLPGVRDMATLASVNVNTVRTVYGRLADEGLIKSEHGRGTFVGERSRARDELTRLAHEAAGTARAAGIDPRDLAVALYAEPAEAAPSPPPQQARLVSPPEPVAAVPPTSETRNAEARRRASLRAEIALLERELAALVPTNGGTEETADPTRRPAPQLLTAAELEGIRDDLIARLHPLRADRTVARDELERERAETVERELERTGPQHQRAIATSTPRFETGAGGGWSIRLRG
jgi:DNA-binding transcriptional regulator YhcF (GntR family)